MKNFRALLVLLIMVHIFESCRESESLDDLDPANLQSSLEERAADAFGVDVSELKNYNFTTEQLIELSKFEYSPLPDAELEEFSKEHEGVQVCAEKSHARQQFSTQYPSRCGVAYIRVGYASSVSGQTLLDLTNAINQWNSDASNSAVSFQLTNSCPKLVVKKESFGGLGKYFISLSSGYPYGTIKVDPTYFPTLPVSQRKNVLMHEMGHSIAMCHTDQNLSCGVQVPGTNSNDQASIMWSYVQGTTSLSAYDKVAVNWLYPKYPLCTNPICPGGGGPN